VVLLNFGRRRYLKIRSAAKSSAVLPTHKSTGKANYNAVQNNERKYLPLKYHFEYLLNLGEVRAWASLACDAAAVDVPAATGYKTNIDPRMGGAVGGRGRGKGGASRIRGGRRVFFSGVLLVDTMMDLLSFFVVSPAQLVLVMGLACVRLFF
jgi:hypothetical protein